MRNSSSTSAAHQGAAAGGIGHSEALARVRWQLRELHRLTLAEHPSYPDLYEDYLRTGLALLDMDVGIVSSVSDQEYSVLAVQPVSSAYAAGDVFPLADTLCVTVIATGGTIAVPDLSHDARTRAHPVIDLADIGSYLAVPIRVNGVIHGTLSFTGRDSRAAAFAEEDLELVELMARSLGQAIERDLMDRERAATQHLVYENSELFENAFRHAPIGMALVGTDGQWLRVNQAVTDMLGYSEAELLTMDFQSVTHPDDLDSDMDLVQSVLEGSRDSYRLDKRYLHRDGHIVWAELSVCLVRGEAGRPCNFISQFQDVTETKRTEFELARKNQELEQVNTRLEQLAMVDALTQVLNRRAFSQRLEAEVSNSRRTGLPLSLLLVDIDHFKTFNDDFGHPAGDRALKRVADALTQAGRNHDVVARYGGEEFAVILPNTDSAGAVVVAERMRKAVCGISGIPRSLTASFGAATKVPRRRDVEPAPLDPGDLVRQADQALYAAKNGGRNCFRHAESLASAR